MLVWTNSLLNYPLLFIFVINDPLINEMVQQKRLQLENHYRKIRHWTKKIDNTAYSLACTWAVTTTKNAEKKNCTQNNRSEWWNRIAYSICTLWFMKWINCPFLMNTSSLFCWWRVSARCRVLRSIHYTYVDAWAKNSTSGVVLWYHVDFICRCRIVDDDFLRSPNYRFFSTSVSNGLEELNKRGWNQQWRETQREKAKNDRLNTLPCFFPQHNFNHPTTA